MPLSASGTLSEKRLASAAERLAAKGKPQGADAKGKPQGASGDVVTTIKMRKRFAEVADQSPGIQFEDWLAEQGYGIGDNGQVYKK